MSYSTSKLVLANYDSNSYPICFQTSSPCFSYCVKSLFYQQVSSTTANFGPYSSAVFTPIGNCNCNIFNISNAAISGSTTSGASSNNNPFSSVVIKALSDGSTLQVTYVGGTAPFAGQTCALNYYVSCGPPVNGASYYYFGYWWAVVVGIIVFFIFFCGFCIFCGLCASFLTAIGRGPTNKSQGQTIREPLPPPVYISNGIPMQTYDINNQPPAMAYPVAEVVSGEQAYAVPVAATGISPTSAQQQQSVAGYNTVPIAQTAEDDKGRQVAMV